MAGIYDVNKFQRTRSSRNSLIVILLVTSSSLAVGGDEDPSDFSFDVPEQCEEEPINCATDLLPGQFLCLDLNIDPETQQLSGCQRVDGDDGGDNARAPQKCVAIPGIVCSGSCNNTFTMEVDCTWTNDYHFDTALLLSIFLGMFGADRFYLGYPAIGLLKFSTLGFFFIGHLVDIILIATQSLEPADGSHYVINYFGAGLTKVSVSDQTYRREQPDWY